MQKDNTNTINKHNIDITIIKNHVEESKLTSDIENQQHNLSLNTNTIPEIEENSIVSARFFAFILFFAVLLINGSFMICDIYFGLEDKSCVTQNIQRISINLKTFLLVRGFLVLAFLSEILLSISLLTQKTLPFCSCFQMSLLMFVSMFLIAWNIVGAIIFWRYMDTDKCDNPVYNYTFASLIIFFISAGMNMFASSKKKE